MYVFAVRYEKRILFSSLAAILLASHFLGGIVSVPALRGVLFYNLDWKFRLYQAGLLVVTLGPWIMIPSVMYLAWGHDLVRPLDVGLFLVLHHLIGAGVTVGLHRYFTHRSFQAKRGVVIALLILALMALEGKVTEWVPNHVFHHATSDTDEDLHSPTHGLVHAHFGWLFSNKHADVAVWASWLLKDVWIVRLDRLFPLFALLSFAIPAVVGGGYEYFFGDPNSVLWGMFLGFFWGGVVRMFATHHVTWTVNSLGHAFGDMPYKSTKGDLSRNVPWWFLFMPWLTLGEIHHRTHHAFPKSARHGTSCWNDWSFALLCFLRSLGWVWGLIIPSEEQLAAQRMTKAA